MNSDCPPPIHLLRLVSPTLPTGAFSYSRGLESAVHHGWVTNEAQAAAWIYGTLEHSFARIDGPLFLCMTAALRRGDADAFVVADDWVQASRESRELQMEDRLMGDALRRLLVDLDIAAVRPFRERAISFPAGFALAAHHWRIEPRAALTGLLWMVVEGQVSAAIRLVPLGQTTGQRILIGAVDVIGHCARIAESTPDDEIGNTAVGMAMASAWHEHQHSRLFRS
ncbi:urease accessory protein UreF [Pseudochelatococcus sp. B33]